MALILQLETSTSSCSVALAEAGATIALKELNERNAHAGNLTLFIEEVLKQAGKRMSDLDAIAVSMGPGSYTGLRIGVSTAKGLCYALDKPLITVGTLLSMAAGLRKRFIQEGLLFCPMIDARRMEVYTAIYDADLSVIKPVEAKIIDESSFAELLAERRIVFFGDGAEKCQQVLSGSPNAVFESGFLNSSADMSELAYAKFVAGQFEDVAYFEPYYLKDFVAGKPKGSL